MAIPLIDLGGQIQKLGLPFKSGRQSSPTNGYMVCRR